MKADKIVDVQWLQGRYSSGTHTDSASLQKNLLTTPELYKTMAYAYGDKYFLGNITTGAGNIASKTEALGNVEYAWALMGDLTRPIPISANQGTVVDSGAGFVPFTVLLPEDYFFEGCVVKFQDSNIQARVTGIPVAVGTDFLYTFVIVASDPSVFVPASDLRAGKLITHFYTAYEEGSTGGGAFSAYPMMLKNQLTILRQSRSITGSASTDVMQLICTKASGAKTMLWTPYAQYMDNLEWERQLEYYRMYGQYNRLPNGESANKGANGRPVHIGNGLVNQIARANKMLVSPGGPTLDQMYDFMLQLQLASPDAENTQFVMSTGALGMKNFNNTVLAGAKAYQQIDTTFTTKHGMGLKFNNQNYRTLQGILGTTLTVVHNPIQDDRTKHTAIDPISGLPKESGSMYIFQNGKFGGESNISLVHKKDRAYKAWTVAGSTSPDGTMANGMRASDVDGYSTHVIAEQGIKVVNPLACGAIIYN